MKIFKFLLLVAIFCIASLTSYSITMEAASQADDTAKVAYDQSAEIYAPKLFSPNMTPFWEIGNIELFPECEIIIFNRSGLQVFKAKPYNNDWNGTFNGNPLPEGDYYFVLRCDGKKNLKSGSILLVR